MASSDEGYVENAEVRDYLEIPLVDKLFHEDPARLQLFLELAPHLRTPLRCLMDTSRVNLAVNITARSVLDLTNEETLQILDVGKEQLLEPTDSWETATKASYTLTQRIGLAAWDAPGIDGILAPSALSKEFLSKLVTHPVNLILFMHEKENHLPRSNSVAIEAEEEFIKLTKLFWVHRPQWLIEAIEKHEPDAALTLKNIGRR